MARTKLRERPDLPVAWIVEIALTNPVTEVEEILYFSTHHLSLQNDDLATVVHYDPRVVKAFELNRSIPISLNRFGGMVESSLGTVVIANPDGKLDYLLDYPITSKSIQICVLSRGYADGTHADTNRADVYTRLYGTISGVTFNSGSITFELTDNGADLKKTSATPTKWGKPTAGTPAGFRHGGNSLRGDAKPVSFGECFGVGGQQYRSNRRVFFADNDCVAQVILNGSSVEEIDTNWYSANQQHAKVFSDPKAGPIHIITGAKDYDGTPPAGVTAHPVQAGYVMNQIKDYYDPDTGDRPADCDVTINYEGSYPEEDINYDIGIHAHEDNMTIHDMYDGLGKSIGGIFGISAVGHVYFNKLNPAADDDPWERQPGQRWMFDDTNIIDNTFTLNHRIEPCYTARVSYRENYNRSRQAEMGNNFAAELYSRVRRWAMYTNESVGDLFGKENRSNSKTFLARKDDANREAKRRAEMFAKIGLVFTFKSLEPVLDLRVGDVVILKQPRYGLDDGKNVRIIGMKETAGQATEYTVWLDNAQTITEDWVNDSTDHNGSGYGMATTISNSRYINWMCLVKFDPPSIGTSAIQSLIKIGAAGDTPTLAPFSIYMSYGDTTSNTLLVLKGRNSSGTLVLDYRWFINAGFTEIFDGNWHHFAFSINNNSSGGFTRFYVDGEDRTEELSVITETRGEAIDFSDGRIEFYGANTGGSIYDLTGSSAETWFSRNTGASFEFDGTSDDWDHFYTDNGRPKDHEAIHADPHFYFPGDVSTDSTNYGTEGGTVVEHNSGGLSTGESPSETGV